MSNEPPLLPQAIQHPQHSEQSQNKGRLRLQKKAIILGCIVIALVLVLCIVIRHGKAYTPQPLGLSAACRVLEANGFLFKSDNSHPEMRSRFVTYTDDPAKYGLRMGGFKIECELDLAPDNPQVSAILVYVRGPFIDTQKQVSQAQMTWGLARATATELIPGCSDDIDRAISSAEKRGGDSNAESESPRSGELRMQGVATTASGWRVTYVEYLMANPHSTENATYLLMFEYEGN